METGSWMAVAALAAFIAATPSCGSGGRSSGGNGTGGNGTGGNGTGGNGTGGNGTGGNGTGGNGTGGNGTGGNGTGGNGTGGNDGGVAACTAVLTPGASIAWLDDGVSKCADSVTINRTMSPGIDSLEISGMLSSGLGLSIHVAVALPATLAGAYPCNADSGIDAMLGYSSFPASAASSCTITITSAGVAGGANATGTFSAVLNLASGGTKTISNGTFDVPVKMPGG